ncbi:hypothetical protein [Sorangium cellulosum]|uniref:hypothetical protein n=1 Tax=Sorangium cellulosum TaxID=56 RepID=UPI0016517934|nr:hypothetical protein [Sorangium cellulosum]
MLKHPRDEELAALDLLPEDGQAQPAGARRVNADLSHSGEGQSTTLWQFAMVQIEPPH